MIPTGLVTLDLRLGGGLPRGAITEVFGPTSSAKTALAFHFIKNAPQEKVLYVSADNDFPDDWVQRVGIDKDKLDICIYDKDSNYFDTLCHVLSQYSLVIVDTITNLMALSVHGAADIGVELNKNMESLYAAVVNSNTALVALNQVRSPIGEFGYHRTTCGRLLKCFSARRIRLDGGGYIRTASNKSIGRTIYYRVLKTPGLQPYTRQDLSLYYDFGISSDLDAIRAGLQLGLLGRDGSWIHKVLPDGSGKVLGQGLQGALDGLYLDCSWQSYCSELSQAIAEHKTKMSIMNSSSPR